jgi:hypothetical protein
MFVKGKSAVCKKRWIDSGNVAGVRHSHTGRDSADVGDLPSHYIRFGGKDAVISRP